MNSTGRKGPQVFIKPCIFCANELHPTKSKVHGKSDEHIIPKWLLRHLGIGETNIMPMRMNTETGQIIDHRYHSLSNFVAGRVCAECNSGWLSNLETAAMPILKRMVDYPNEITTLPSGERAILARWTAKTAAILNRASTHGNPADPDCRPVPDAHLRCIMSGSIPDDIVVVAGGYDSQKTFDWVQSATWVAPNGRLHLKAEDQQRSYKIVIGLRNLLLAVAYYPAPDYRYAAIRGGHFPLWEGTRRLLLFDGPGIDLPRVFVSPALEAFLADILALPEMWLTLTSASQLRG